MGHVMEEPDAAAITVEVEGAGPALALLHAAVADRHMWDRQWAWLGQSFRVLRWDWPGWGTSPGTGMPVSWAGVVHRVLDAQGITRVTLVGASAGGAAAIRYALNHPERVDRLVLVGTGLHGLRETDPLETRLAAALEARDFERARTLAQELWVVGRNRRREDVSAAYLDQATRFMARAVGPAWTVPDVDSRRSDVERLAELTMPALIIVGAHDTDHHVAVSRMLAERLPRAQLEVIEGAAHLPNLERPRRFDAILADWLADTKAAANAVE